MTQEKQVEAICRANGWVWHGKHNLGGSCLRGWVHVETDRFTRPDYLNSRDAMAEPLAGLTSDREREDFSRNLLKLVALHKPYFDGQECFWDYFHCTTATPAQLAEAYLRTKGLWKDGE